MARKLDPVLMDASSGLLVASTSGSDGGCMKVVEFLQALHAAEKLLKNLQGSSEGTQ